MRGRLYRSRTDRMLGGVCGGLGEYLGVDPTLVRLVFVIVALTGTAILIYPALWIIVPSEDQATASAGAAFSAGATEMAEQARNLGEKLGGTRGSESLAGMVVGAILIIFGIGFLIENLHITWLAWLNVSVLWPLLLIMAGVVLIQRRTARGAGEEN